MADESNNKLELAHEYGSTISTSNQISRSSNVQTLDKEQDEVVYLSPVIMVLQPHTSPGYTPLQCKEFLSSSNVSCRICHEDDISEKLISPCNCTGSLGVIHIRCLEKWLSTSNTNKCEICNFEFCIKRHSKSFWQWLTSGAMVRPKYFLADLLCLLILSPLCLISVYLCGFGARKYLEHNSWEGTGLALLCFFLMTAFILWCTVTIRFHWKVYKEWQKGNQVVHLVFQRCNEECIIEVNNNSHEDEVGSPVTPSSTIGMNVFPSNEEDSEMNSHL